MAESNPDNASLTALMQAVQRLDPEQRAEWIERARSDPRLAQGAQDGADEDDGHDSDRPLARTGHPTEMPTLAGSPSNPAPSRPEAIGPYRLLELLGEGGMGQVYLAEQKEPIERQVAVKLINSILPSQVDVFRFEAERQALARMSHPNIAQVYEAGNTDNGLPYLVMEFVAGDPITNYCDDRKLDLDDRLEIFLQVCRGVRHAHQKGILHRDIKPNNVLVTEVEGRPRPKLIDFGIAKDLENPLGAFGQLTRSGTMIGTPAYLCPEAILEPDGGDPDWRADVYSLGVILFQLLVGGLPFFDDSASMISWIRKLQTEDPPTASRRLVSLSPEEAAQRAELRSTTPALHARRLRGDLDGILLKALAKQPDERYGSVAELTGDIQRYRRLEPVTARPPSRWYLTKRLLQRHKGLFTATTLLLLSLVAGLAVRTHEAKRANREAERANMEAAASREVADFLVELFTLSNPSESRGNTVTARELLDRGAERVQLELENQPATRARLMEEIGGVYDALGLYDQAENLLTQALEARGKIGTDQVALASNLSKLGLVYYHAGRYPEAEDHLLRSLEIQRRVFGNEAPETATLLSHLGDLYELEGKNAEAEELLRKALDIREATLDEQDPLIAESYERLGVVLSHGEDQEESERLLRKALEIRKQVLGEDHPRIALSLNNLAIVRAQAGALEEARDLFAEAFAIRERILDPGHPDLGQSLHNLGVVYEMMGEIDTAIDHLRRAGDLWTATLGDSHPRVAPVWHQLGSIEADRGKLKEAEAYHRRGLALREKALGPDALGVANSLESLADLLRDDQREAEAIELYRRALAIRTAQLPEDDPNITSLRTRLAELEAGESG